MVSSGDQFGWSIQVVPFTRGRERSRDPHSIIEEINDLYDKGFREVTLLGQNVDSYEWENDAKTEKISFANLLALTAQVKQDMRIRFSTSHPKDLTDDVLYTMRDYENICKSIHLPVQSGSTRILDLMNRTYSREWYINRIDSIRNILPGCTISTDIIAGFCTETEEEHQETLSMMEYVKYDFAYMFSYSERPGTPAAKKLKDDVSEEVKLIQLGRRAILALRQNLISKIHEHDNTNLYKQFKDLVGDIYTAEVHHVRPKMVVLMDDDGNEIILPKDKQIPNDFFKKGENVRGIIESVELKGNKPQIIMSRTAPDFLDKLFEQEIPEVFDGLITVKKVVRIPGEKAKVAVDSYDDRIDPVGACVGMKGSRIHGIVRELGNENIDVINYTNNIQLNCRGRWTKRRFLAFRKGNILLESDTVQNTNGIWK